LINGARAALINCENKTNQVSIWARQLKERSNYNNATVALANLMARMAWAICIIKKITNLKPQLISVNKRVFRKITT